MIKKKIPLHEPHFISYSNKYLLNCTRNNWVSSSGSYVDLFEKKMCDLTKSNSAVAVLNGTIGLQLSLILSQVKHGEEVIVPTITFVATVNAIIHVGANPIFVDTEETLNIDEEKCIKFIKKKTYFQNNYTYNSKTGKKIKALFVVHTFGNAAKFEKLYILCKKRNIKIIEDAAESIGTKYLSGKQIER
jgi:perosamine synthetase